MRKITGACRPEAGGRRPKEAAVSCNPVARAEGSLHPPRPLPLRGRTRQRLQPALTIVACAFVLFAAGNAAAALYKWTDANGRVVYSDQPPTGNVKYERVDGAPPPSNPNAVQEMAAKEADFKKRQTDAVKAEKKSDTERIQQAKRNEMCDRARSNIRTLAAEQVALVRHNEKGEQVVVDDATRRRERVEIEAWVKANCAT